MSELFKQIVEKLYAGEAEEVAGLTQQALNEGISPAEILNDGLLVGMDKVGRDFKAGDLFVPEVLIAARAMHAGMNVLKPFLTDAKISSAGKMVIGTVQGDLHDIGKNLVAMMMEGAGFEVVDLGIDVPPKRFVEAVGKEKPDLLGMSALLTTTMPMMKTTIEALEEAEMRHQVKVIVGGAPVTQAWAEEIGADGYAPDAASAVDKAKELLGKS